MILFSRDRISLTRLSVGVKEGWGGGGRGRRVFSIKLVLHWNKTELLVFI